MLRAVLTGLIRLYQSAISPWLPPACRYEPTCSAYALEAIERHGALGGSGMAIRRLCRCHPWGGSGYDPVPLNPTVHTDSKESGERSVPDPRAEAESFSVDDVVGIGS